MPDDSINLAEHERQAAVDALKALPRREQSPESMGELVDVLVAAINEQREQWRIAAAVQAAVEKVLQHKIRRDDCLDVVVTLRRRDTGGDQYVRTLTLNDERGVDHA